MPFVAVRSTSTEPKPTRLRQINLGIVSIGENVIVMGRYEDVNGNSRIEFASVVWLFNNP